MTKIMGTFHDYVTAPKNPHYGGWIYFRFHVEREKRIPSVLVRRIHTTFEGQPQTVLPFPRSTRRRRHIDPPKIGEVFGFWRLTRLKIWGTNDLHLLVLSSDANFWDPSTGRMNAQGMSAFFCNKNNANPPSGQPVLRQRFESETSRLCGNARHSTTTFTGVYYLQTLDTGPKHIHSRMLPKRGWKNWKGAGALFVRSFIKKLYTLWMTWVQDL
jgi:hypothetical protein